MASMPILAGNLPSDVLFDILQLLPAKELCRLRTVCRSWRSLLTSDQAFIMALADRHKEPLFLAKFRDDQTHVYVVDLSDNVVKRIAGADGGHHVLRTRLNLVRSQLTLADMKVSLVLANHCRCLSTVHLWFLMDFESGLWVKEYSIWTESITSSLADLCHLISLLALDDGRLLVIYLAPIGLLYICDPGTNNFTQVDMRHRLDSVGVYTRSLLSLQEGDIV